MCMNRNICSGIQLIFFFINNMYTENETGMKVIENAD
jgi:hypothetical protein